MCVCHNGRSRQETLGQSFLSISPWCFHFYEAERARVIGQILRMGKLRPECVCLASHCSSRVEAAQIPGPSPGVSRAAVSPEAALSPAGIAEILMNRPSARNALGNVFVSQVRVGTRVGWS